MTEVRKLLKLAVLRFVAVHSDKEVLISPYQVGICNFILVGGSPVFKIRVTEKKAFSGGCLFIFVRFIIPDKQGFFGRKS